MTPLFRLSHFIETMMTILPITIQTRGQEQFSSSNVNSSNLFSYSKLLSKHWCENRSIFCWLHSAQLTFCIYLKWQHRQILISQKTYWRWHPWKIKMYSHSSAKRKKFPLHEGMSKKKWVKEKSVQKCVGTGLSQNSTRSLNRKHSL